MLACEVWLRRDYLARHVRDPGPPCDHPEDLCPPLPDQAALAEVVPIKPTAPEAADVPR